MHSRVSSVVSLAAFALALAGCGGGSGGGGDSVAAGQVLGQVVLRDGSSDDLGGVVVTCEETGDAAVTDADGRFALDVPPGADFEMAFDDPAATGADGGDCDESDDPARDSADIDGNVVKGDGVDRGETCECEVVLEDGQVVECRFTREGKDGAGEDDLHEGEAKLYPSEEYAFARGELELRLGDDRCVVAEVEVGGFDAGRRFEVFVHHGEGDAALLGVLETGEGGGAHLEVSWCGDEPLPFGVPSVKELAGLLVLVLDEAGHVVFEGHLPRVGVEGDEKKDGEGEAKLYPSDAYAFARGWLTVRRIEACAVVEVEIGGFERPRRFEVTLHAKPTDTHPEGEVAPLGVVETGELGGGVLRLEWCADDALPFGVDSVDALAGLLVLVRDEEHQVAFEGHFPRVGEAKEPGDDGDDGEGEGTTDPR
jgi:hypothetical protein